MAGTGSTAASGGPATGTPPDHPVPSTDPGPVDADAHPVPAVPSPGPSGPGTGPSHGSGPTLAESPITGQRWTLPRGLIVLLGTASLIIVIAGLRGAAELLGPILLALMLVVTVSPLQNWLLHRGAPRWLASLVTLLAVYAIMVGLTASLVVSAAQLATVLPDYQDRFSELVGQSAGILADAGVGQDQINSAVSQFDLGSVVGVVQSFLTSLVNILSDFVFILALLFFMGVDAAGFPDRMRAAETLRPDLVGALRNFTRGTQRYLLVSTIFGLIVAVLDVGILYWLSVPLPLVWGLLAFVTNYIPNIGFVIGLVPPALLALLDGGWQDALWVIALFTVANTGIQSFIQPRFVGDAVGISTSITFLSLVFWGWVLGGLGALLAVPLTLLAKSLLLDIDPSTRWVNLLVSSRGPDARAEQPPASAADPDRATALSA